MRPLLLLLLAGSPAFAGDWSDAYRKAPCEVQGNTPKVKCEHCGAACPCGECGCAVGQFPRVTAPKCAICGPKCQCVTCGCPKSAAVETATARTARLHSVACRTEMLELSTGRHWFRDWTVGEYLAAGGDPATLGTSAAFTAEDRAFLRGQVVEHPVAAPMPVSTNAQYQLVTPQPVYPQSVYTPPARGMSAGFQFRGPFGGGFQAGACVGNR